MNKQVSQESLSILAATGASFLVKHFGPKVVDKLLEHVSSKRIKNSINAVGAMNQTDLVRFTQSARVEPILLMDKRAVNIPFIQDVVQSLYNMFAGYYLMAISLDTTINGVSVGKRLDKFATDRDLITATQTMLSTSLESMVVPEVGSFGLPFVEEILAARGKTSMESVDDDAMVSATIVADLLNISDADERAAYAARWDSIQAQTSERIRKEEEAKFKEELALAKKEMKDEYEDKKKQGVMGASVSSAAGYVERIRNLAVGNVIDVSIEHEGKRSTVPVTIRLRVASMPSSSIIETLAVGGTDVTSTSRYRAWRAGEIKFWADLVLQMDRVDAHRAAMMKDETGYYKTVYKRAKNNSIAAAMSQGPSMSTASSIVVLDAKTASDLERRINGRLDDFRVRQGIFGHTFSMLMAVVDPDWESVTIYTRGIEMPTRLQANDIKMTGAKGSDGKDIMEILKAFQLGKAPGRL